MKAPPQPLVSIITPVYNEEIHLAECIESVLAQTYPHWEYVVVDNCSTDSSAQIARHYAEKDQRIRVYKNPSVLRAVPNHNSALRRISPLSKYCKIVFADDWIFPECLERMVSLAEEYSSIGIVGAYVLEGQKIICAGLPYQARLVSGREICRQVLLDKLYVFGSPNAVLYRADLVRSNDPFFNEANIHADTEACFVLLKSTDFGFVHQILSFTRMRPASLSSISSDLQTNLAGTVQLLVKHAPDYLAPDEVAELLRHHVILYYKFLGKTLLLGRKKTLDYHKKKLIQAGVGFSLARVFVGALATLFDLAANPKSTAQKLLTRFRSDEVAGRASEVNLPFARTRT